MSLRWAFVMAIVSMYNFVRPSVNNFFKQLLLNHLANCVKTLQGCFLHEALPKMLKELNFMQNSGCRGNRKIKKNLGLELW